MITAPCSTAGSQDQASTHFHTYARSPTTKKKAVQPTVKHCEGLCSNYKTNAEGEAHRERVIGHFNRDGVANWAMRSTPVGEACSNKW